MKLPKFIILVFSLFFFSGCGSGNGSSPNNPLENTADLPPDPGDAGKITLQGIDNDNDGVRDDVQIAIYERYPSDETKRNILTQNAKALQEAIYARDLSEINQASKSVMDAVDCLHERVDDPTSEIGFLEHAIVNTSDRSEAYITFNASLSNQFFGGDDTNNPCQ